jgi:RNA polymerase sigma-70 factor (ECF subfamily)
MPHTMTPTDMELVRAAQNGNMNAFEVLVHRYDNNVLGLTARYCNSRDDAKDIYQEVFMRVFRNIHKFEGRSEFSTWLYRITANVCLTFRSQKKKMYSLTMNLDDDDDHHSEFSMIPVSAINEQPDSRAEAADISSRIHDALQLLSPQQKLVFIMKHYQGYKLREIASFMKCAEGTVKRYLFTATKRLRLQLEDLQEVFQ